MNGWQFGAHAFWASACGVTCAVSPVVPLGLATIAAVFAAWMIWRGDRV